MIDHAAVLRGAAVALAVLVPPVAVVRALLGNDDDSALWSVIPLAFLVAFTAGGSVAARRSTRAPLVNGAVAAGAAFGAALAVGVVRNLLTGWSMGIAALVTAVLFWQIAASLGMLGAFLAVRRARVTPSNATGVQSP